MYEFWGWVWFSGELRECMNVHAFLVLIPNEYERWGNNYLNSKSALRNHLVGVLIYVTNDDIISAYVDVYVAFCYLFQV